MAGIGEYVHLVEVSRAGPTPDDPEGGYERTWAALDPPTWYCAIVPANARDLERISGGAFTQTATHLIRGRYHPQLAADCRITFRGSRVFEVASVHNPDGQQIELTVIATELVGVVPTPVTPQPPLPHAPTHQPGGTDPIGPQPPAIHAATHAAGGTDPIPAAVLPSDVAIAGSVAIGTNPAQSGTLRLASGALIVGRGASGTNDINYVELDAGNNLQFAGAAIGLNAPVYTQTVNVSASVAVGTNPAQSGALRLASQGEVTSRNGANTGDVRALRVRNDDVIEIGNAGNYTQFLGPILFFDGGINAMRGVVRVQEMPSAGTPAANEAYIWLQDTGAGKSQLMIQFATGAAIAIATQV